MSFENEILDLLREIVSLTEDDDKHDEDALREIQCLIVDYFKKRGDAL